MMIKMQIKLIAKRHLENDYIRIASELRMDANFRRLYIILPRVSSGGPELGHQLVDNLRGKGLQAFVVYIDENGIIRSSKLMEQYAMYNVAIANEIEDSPENILVLPETLYNFAREYTKIRIYCWWMSVDKFIASDLHRVPIQWYSQKSIFKNIRKNLHVALWHLPLKRYDILGYLRGQKERVIHLYQSEYAHQFIVKHNLGTCAPLSDYINRELIPNYEIDRSKKENIVLYNPAKGLAFTQKVITLLPEYNFVPLKNLTREQLKDCFDKAKLYIDFGNFPGKDRLPREAVLHACCIITGRLGASAYHEDVPIRDEYKFDVVVNLAAQAGVRYSIDHPDVYIESNLIGFYNILEACRHSYDNGKSGVEHLVYASSSSVYGSNKKVPYSTDDKVDNPVSFKPRSSINGFLSASDNLDISYSI